ncbi:MAG: hypothetical protein LBK73_04125 [Treponema sp.]|nr:hypothetical protein [Treponema sp.]
MYKSSGFLPLDVNRGKQTLLDGRHTHFAIVYHEGNLLECAGGNPAFQGVSLANT